MLLLINYYEEPARLMRRLFECMVLSVRFGCVIQEIRHVGSF